MLSRLRSYLRPPTAEEPRQRYAVALLHVLLLVLSLVSLTALFALPRLGFARPLFISIRAGLVFLASLIAQVLLRKGHPRAAGALIIGIAWVGITITAVGTGGVSYPNTATYGVLILISSIVLGATNTLILTAIAILTAYGLLYAEQNGVLIPPSTLASPTASWGIYTAYFVFTGAVLFFYRRGLDAALDELQENQRSLLERNAELDALRQSMEAQVKERTRQLEEQSALMEHILRAARQIAGIQNTAALLETAVTLIHREFGLYHVGIYLPDASGEYVVLHAASSEGGRELLAQGQRLRIGSEGLIGAAAATRQIHVTADTRAAPLYLGTPELPETRSEAILPLSVGGRLLGILDIQSDKPNAFTETSVTILQYLADQIAGTLQSARLYAEGQRALRRAERAYAEISARSWRQFVQGTPWAGFRSVTGEVVPLPKDLDEDIPPEICDTVRSGQVYAEGDTAIIPIRVRRQTIASLRLRKTTRSAWGKEELHLMQAVSDQIAQALESARLYEESRKLAAREQLLSTSTSRIRATLDLENVLQTAVRELRSALGLSEAEIRLGAPPPAAQQTPAATEKSR